MLKSLFEYRGFIFGSIKREFQSKYQNSLFGVAWTILGPLAMIFVYTVIFSQVMRAKLPGIEGNLAYSIYLCAGTLSWGLFGEITQRMQSCFIDNANLLKKLIFPRLCLPIIVVGNALVNFSIIFTIFTLFLVLTKNFPGWVFFEIFPILGVLLLMAVGIGVIIGVLNVFFRDVGQFFGIFLQFWFWFTPIVYPLSILPPKAQKIIAFNPLAPIIASLQNVLVVKTSPQWGSLLYPLIFSSLMCWIGFIMFKKNIADMVDEL